MRRLREHVAEDETRPTSVTRLADVDLAICVRPLSPHPAIPAAGPCNWGIHAPRLNTFFFFIRDQFKILERINGSGILAGGGETFYSYAIGSSTVFAYSESKLFVNRLGQSLESKRSFKIIEYFLKERQKVLKDSNLCLFGFMVKFEIS